MSNEEARDLVARLNRQQAAITRAGISRDTVVTLTLKTGGSSIEARVVCLHNSYLIVGPV